MELNLESRSIAASPGPIADAIRAPQASAVRLHGLLGRRLDLLRRNRLVEHDEYFLLWPFIEKHRADPERHYEELAPHPEITRGDWHGEFMGTWIATATLVAINAADAALLAKVDRMVDEWLATQADDGYLGPYVAADRWQSWDIWIQAHNLIGLIVYSELTGRAEALEAAIRVADRVLADFGPGRRSLQATGPSAGMASSAILEPSLRLHLLTDDARYLEFARWIVDVDWEAGGGPAIVSSLMRGDDVAEISTGKGAEMLIDFAGLLELYRTTGEERYMAAVKRGWDNIAADHLYITGTATANESFQRDQGLPSDGAYRVGETCVTMAWFYVSLMLGRLTGEGRYFDAVEQTTYNHLLAAQSADGRGWAYYVGLRDSKRYGWHTDPECCPTRGSRALSLLPQAVVGTDSRGVVVNLYEACTGALTLDDGQPVALGIEGDYPLHGDIRIRIRPHQPSAFRLSLRVPAWCNTWRMEINGELVESTASGGYCRIERRWTDGDVVGVSMEMAPAYVIDHRRDSMRVAVVRGPLVFAADSAYLPPGRLLEDITLSIMGDQPELSIGTLPKTDPPTIHLDVPVESIDHPSGRQPWRGQRFVQLGAHARRDTETLELVPFFEAGNQDPACYDPGVRDRREPVLRITYQVWQPYAMRRKQ